MKNIHIALFVAGVAAFFVTSLAQAKPKQDWSVINYSSSSGPCPPGEVCFVNWQIKHATGTLERTGRGGALTRKLNDAQLADVQRLAIQTLKEAPTCSQPPTDWFVTLTITYEDGTNTSESVTGCLAQDGQNSAKALQEVLQN